MTRKPVTCPNCGEETTDYEFGDRSVAHCHDDDCAVFTFDRFKQEHTADSTGEEAADSFCS